MGAFLKGSDKSNVLACSPLNFFSLEFSINQNTLQILWDVIKAILLHLQMCWWCSRAGKSEERKFTDKEIEVSASISGG